MTKRICLLCVSHASDTGLINLSGKHICGVEQGKLLYT
nr:MAG TPA: hypothetical protein [Caudoviricetes sp.]